MARGGGGGGSGAGSLASLQRTGRARLLAAGNSEQDEQDEVSRHGCKVLVVLPMAMALCLCPSLCPQPGSQPGLG
ncbi:hypothetical protein DHEL01_v201913 [Diaporthe helianthi]|uniref:Uncharacterized protein n=1 Tax=Diaporthe helianthi TaxID=158607 RepID=A0A2P5IB92_DIAHE|nr:hypothetical protein DHEL01_v201913 [Diaporthe helianthi]